MPTQEELNRLLCYDPSTGVLTYKVCRGKKHAGEIVGSRHCAGYIQHSINKKRLMAHRVIWTMLHGGIADGLVIDHINGNRMDNRLENLRLVSMQDNSRNMRRPKNNKSGVTGVYWLATKKRWRVNINVFDRTIHIGHFKTFEDAVFARKQAEATLGFHPNHGRP